MRRLIIGSMLVLFCQIVLAAPSLRIVEDQPGYLVVEGEFFDILREHKHSIPAVQYFFSLVQEKISGEKNAQKIFLSTQYRDEIRLILKVKRNGEDFLLPQYEELLNKYFSLAQGNTGSFLDKFILRIPFDEFWQEAPSSVINGTNAALRLVEAFGTQFLKKSDFLLEVHADFLAFKEEVGEGRSRRELTWSEERGELIDLWVSHHSRAVWEKLWEKVFTDFRLKLDPNTWGVQDYQQFKDEIEATPVFHLQEIAADKSFAEYRTIFLEGFLGLLFNKSDSQTLDDTAKKLLPAYHSLLFKLGLVQVDLLLCLRLRASLCGYMPSGDRDQAFAGGNTCVEVLEHFGWSKDSLWKMTDSPGHLQYIGTLGSRDITYNEMARLVEIYYLSVANSPQIMNEIPLATDIELDVPELMEFLNQKRDNPYLLPLLTTLEQCQPH